MYTPVPQSIVSGIRCETQERGSVVKNCRRTGETGTSTPSRSPTWPAHGPAAFTSHAHSQRSPSATSENPPPPSGEAAVTSQPRRSSTPPRRASAAYPATSAAGVATPSSAQKVAPTRSSVRMPGRMRAASSGEMTSTGAPSARCVTAVSRNRARSASESSRNR